MPTPTYQFCSKCGEPIVKEAAVPGEHPVSKHTATGSVDCS